MTDEPNATPANPPLSKDQPSSEPTSEPTPEQIQMLREQSARFARSHGMPHHAPDAGDGKEEDDMQTKLMDQLGIR